MLLVLLGSAALLFFDLGSRIFTTNDEARFPLLARDIITEGHWLLPRLNGTPHFDKPPLHAWLIALVSWPSGAVSQAGAVVPSLLMALIVILGTFWIGWRHLGPETATIAGLMCATTYGVLDLGRTPTPDMTLCAALTAAMAAYMEVELDGRRGWLIPFYAFVGVAVWTKGPAGLLPLAIALVDSVVEHGWRGLGRPISAPGLLLLASLFVPWWALAATVAGGQRFWIDVVRNDWLQWYAPGPARTWRAFAEGLLQTLSILLPWSIVLPWAWGWASMLPDRQARRHLRLLQLWFAVVLLAVGISREQRMRYYLPLCPAGALLIAAWYTSLQWRRRTMVFACAWAVSALTLSVWGVVSDARASRDAALPTIVNALADTTAPIYALDVPELVFAFYLDRRVELLTDLADVERRVRERRGGYLIIANRLLASAPASLPIHPIATGRFNRRPVSVLALDNAPSGD